MKSQRKTRALRPGFRLAWMRSEASGDGADAGAHQADRVDVGLLAGVLFGALARLVALVEQFDLLQFLEGFAEQRLGVFELDAQFVGRAGQVLPPLDRGLGIGRDRRSGRDR